METMYCNNCKKKIEVKNWYQFKRTITREELLEFGFYCSIPVVGWIALLVVILTKPKKFYKQTEEKKNNTFWIIFWIYLAGLYGCASLIYIFGFHDLILGLSQLVCSCALLLIGYGEIKKVNK